jgi:hypothetical protein
VVTIAARKRLQLSAEFSQQLNFVALSNAHNLIRPISVDKLGLNSRSFGEYWLIVILEMHISNPINFAGRLIIHVGPHKTGTTSIQGALAKEYDRLQAAGILFPKAGRERNGEVLHLHHPLVLSLIGETPSNSRILSDLRNEIQDSNPHSVIISSEVLAREYLSSQVYRDLQRIFPNAERVWVAYLRKQDDLVMSRYAEHIKVGILSWPDNIRHVTRPEYLDHRLRLERLAYAVGDDKIVPVSFDAHKRDLMQSFFEACGVTPTEPMPHATRDNTSLPWRTLYFLRYANALPGPLRRFACRAIRGISRRIEGSNAHRILDARRPLTKQQAEEIRKRYAASNLWVEETYWDGASLLTSDFSDTK